MDIALMSMALSQGQIQQQASMSVMKMAMGDAKQDGDALQKLLNTADPSAIQRATQPHIGGNIDLRG
ncbi:putative motility protein [Bacillus timonensis]|uniref:Putative motility protein n=1 Tax=Bacillus timonensis TaxID=1033734 RepID=A0A4S3PRN6_9BACI|nr:YjfB family protein [Bacillus timonensis]THE12350.1 putative motility protein [Bacillus timonensis]